MSNFLDKQKIYYLLRNSNIFITNQNVYAYLLIVSILFKSNKVIKNLYSVSMI